MQRQENVFVVCTTLHMPLFWQGFGIQGLVEESLRKLISYPLQAGHIVVVTKLSHVGPLSYYINILN